MRQAMDLPHHLQPQQPLQKAIKGISIMRKHLLVTIMALTASTGFAAAGGRDGANYLTEVNVNSASQAVAQSQASSGAIAQGGNVTFNTPASQHIRNSGTTTIRSAPQVVAPSMSSGHPCAYAPVSIGVSVVGFGGAFGGQRIDDACLLAQMQVRNAAISMIAARNPQACRALEATGTIASGSCGGGRRAYAAPVQTRVVYRNVATAPAPRARRVAATNGNGNCRMVQATASTQKKVCG
jgi:hypothetical protein